jgi:peptidoglycan/LPS O-acetylase OafA/YrhL
MRGVAAIMVLVDHGLSTKLGMGVDHVAYFVNYFGSSGVDIFFVISGFIISQNAVNSRSTGRLAFATNFSFRRFTRIYPLYWIVLAASVGVSVWVPLSTPTFPMAPWLSLIFLTTTANWFVFPAWTLAFELYFYVWLVVIMIIAPRHIFPAILVWMAIQAVAGVLYSAYEVHTHALVIEFGFGCLVAYLIDRGARKYAIVNLLIAFMAFYAGAYLTAQYGPIAGWIRVGTFGVGGAFLIYAVVAAEYGGLFFPRIMQYLGDASYSVYIWHALLLAVLVATCESSGLISSIPQSLRPLLVISWIAVALLFALASYTYLERPILHFSRLISTKFG